MSITENVEKKTTREPKPQVSRVIKAGNEELLAAPPIALSRNLTRAMTELHAADPSLKRAKTTKSRHQKLSKFSTDLLPADVSAAAVPVVPIAPNSHQAKKGEKHVPVSTPLTKRHHDKR